MKMFDGKYNRMNNFVTLIKAEHFMKSVVLHVANGCYCFPLPVGTNDIYKVTVPDYSQVSDQPVSG